MRAMLPIPAIGSGEAGLTEAAQGGKSFGLVTDLPESMSLILYERLQARGVLGLCTATMNIGTDADAASLIGPDSYLAEVREGRDAIRARVMAGIECLSAEGASAVMLGCTCMSAMTETIAPQLRSQ
ncbi:MAG: aspartate/glutamate racemase family protein [Blastomonas sp.]|uniref:aspartate/glutamate racemase family protein n=1 Tax=Blastomonas sp. TaxID=1909299 RepID=UPI00406AA93A|nr:aspartate/glutamate racemase family protein [Blastomonas sp.]